MCMQPEEIQTAEQVPSSLSPAAPMPTRADRLKLVFWGPDGLRAFWRLAIFVAIVFGLRFGISRTLRLLHIVKPHLPAAIDVSAKTVLLQESLAFLCVLLATLIMGSIEKRSLGDYGLPRRGAFGIRFFEGLVWGFFAECATMFTLYLTGNVTVNGFDLTGSAAVRYALLWLAAFVMVGFFEEFLFRGYPQFTLSTGIGFWPAALILSGLFWLGHMGNPGETWVGGFATALAALLFCVSLRVTGNLWFAIGMHAAWDWAETYFFGVADSGIPANGHLLNTTLSGSKWMTGGTVGPEGSVVELVIVSAVIGLLFLRFRRRELQRLTAPLS
ncbi:MAG: CPBP family intramembrane metalloprotease domain-containing protein [Acidobacteria bacterium]|nr:MAG: CPBP family intramembrane metalloprotease domain-containing protein [Acidobacteriota bacterium]